MPTENACLLGKFSFMPDCHLQLPLELVAFAKWFYGTWRIFAPAPTPSSILFVGKREGIGIRPPRGLEYVNTTLVRGIQSTRNADWREAACGGAVIPRRANKERSPSNGKGRGPKLEACHVGPEDCTADKNLLSGVKFKDDRQQ